MGRGRPSVMWVMIGVFVLSIAPSTATASTIPRTCLNTNVEVSLSPDAHASSYVAVTLCTPRSRATNVVHVLLPGTTEVRAHWDLSYGSGRYSYPLALNGTGVATLAVDRIGTGGSATPPSPEVTIDADAWVVHQLVGHLRSGSLGTRRFQRVVTVGHSAGAVVAVLEALRYDDVDGLILTSITHHPNAVAVAELATWFEPAVFDPKFAGSGLDPGYTTSRPGLREALFYAPGADPTVIALDEANKSTTTLAQHYGVARFFGAPPPIFTDSLDVPILLVVGSDDALNCGETATDCSSAASLRTAEAASYPLAELETYVLSGAGHNINQAPNASDWFAEAASWTQRTFE